MSVFALPQAILAPSELPVSGGPGAPAIVHGVVTTCGLVTLLPTIDSLRDRPDASRRAALGTVSIHAHTRLSPSALGQVEQTTGDSTAERFKR